MPHNSIIQTRLQQIATPVFAASYFCTSWEIRTFFTFLYCWGEKSQEEYFIICKQYMKIKFQSSERKLCWKTTMHFHSCIVSSCFCILFGRGQQSLIRYLDHHRTCLLTPDTDNTHLNCYISKGIVHPLNFFVFVCIME